MIKRLTLSVMLLAMAAFAMTGAATAYFSATEDAAVAITAGNADLSIGVDLNCDDANYVTPTGPLDLDWEDIYPGEETSDCFEVTNDGDVPLEVEIRFDGASPTSNLLSALEFAYKGGVSQTGFSNAAAPNSTAWTDGYSVGTLQPGDSEDFRVNARFVDSGTAQDNLQAGSAGFTAVIEGRTPGGF